MSIFAAADGSSLGNPGPTGWAWYINDQCWAAGGFKEGTNNLGELTAVLELLRATEAAGLAGEHLEIACDSQYVINSLTKWIHGWKKKNWKKADGKPVLNQELMIELDSALQGRSVEFTWVKGHAGHKENEAADQRARAAAEAYQKGSEPDAGPGMAGAAITGAAAQPEPQPAGEWAEQPTAQPKQLVEDYQSVTDPGVCFDDSLRVDTAHELLLGANSNLQAVAAENAVLIDPRGAEVSAASMQNSIKFLAQHQAPAIENMQSLDLGDALLVSQTVHYNLGENSRSSYQVSAVWKSRGGNHSLHLLQWTGVA